MNFVFELRFKDLFLYLEPQCHLVFKIFQLVFNTYH